MIGESFFTINAKGGVDGRPIKLVIYDDHSSASEGVRAFQRAASEDHAVAVIGSYISEADERSVEVHMGNLRKKLGDSPQQPRWLQTVRGVGYRLAPSVH